MKRDIIRRCIFRPFLKGKGPTFTLTLWDTGRYSEGRSYLGYRLWARENGTRTLLFEGEDYSPSPMDAIDSDGSVACLVGFLTLKPGDTDQEYFDSYTETQLHFCDQWAEALHCAVLDRFEREG